MEPHLTGKTALVTGASRGIGRTIALRLAAAGANLAINYQVNEDAALEAVAKVQREGGRALAVSGDVRDSEAVNDVVARTLEEFGSLHVLVNNAGITQDTLVLKMSDDDWDLVVDTNLRGAFLCTRAALRPMLAQRWGRIINITSVGWLVGNPGQANYTAAKAGVVALTRSTAVEMGSRGITVNAIAPGYIPTDLTHDIPPHLMDRLMQKLPIKRAGTPEEIAELVTYFTSEAASYITGQAIHIDGGLTVGLL
jgi:3-oxoacyl-[acyl-carrier protein] reductase